eukprot:97841_1
MAFAFVFGSFIAFIFICDRIRIVLSPSVLHAITSFMPSPPIATPVTVKKKKKHDGSHQKGKYNKSNPHNDSWSQMLIAQREETKKQCPYVVHDDKKEQLYCDPCRRHRIGCAMATGVSIYSYASSKKKCKQHKTTKRMHVKAMKIENQLNDPNDTSKIQVFSATMDKKHRDKADHDFIEKMRPLVAIAFWVSTNNVAIRKYLSIRNELAPSIIKSMIQVFKETFDTSIVKELDQMGAKYRRKLRELEMESQMENREVIARSKRIFTFKK